MATKLPDCRGFISDPDGRVLNTLTRARARYVHADRDLSRILIRAAAEISMENADNTNDQSIKYKAILFGSYCFLAGSLFEEAKDAILGIAGPGRDMALSQNYFSLRKCIIERTKPQYLETLKKEIHRILFHSDLQMFHKFNYVASLLYDNLFLIPEHVEAILYSQCAECAGGHVRSDAWYRLLDDLGIYEPEQTLREWLNAS